MNTSKYIYKGEHLWLPILYQNYYGQDNKEDGKIQASEFS